jgi:2'-5' RNA ligase
MRLFFAIALPDSARDAVGEALRGIRGASEGVSWTRRANLHVTLRFLGEVAEERVDELAAAVGPWVRRLPPPELRLVGGGAIPDNRHPKVLTVGVEGDLGGLVGAMEGAIQRLGFPAEDRPWLPHLTVGRVRMGRQDRTLSALRELGEIARFRPDGVVLYESRQGEDGYRYVELRALAA